MLETKLYAGEEISHGDEGGEDPGHHRRRLHHVLAAFFHYVCGARVLPESHPSNRLQRAVLARILQFRDKPVYLRPVQQGLPLRFQENHLLQVLLHPTRQHPATRQWRQPIGNEVSVTICITKSARSAIYFCMVLCFFFLLSASYERGVQGVAICITKCHETALHSAIYFHAIALIRKEI